MEELPSLDAVMSEIDSDIDSINSTILADNKFSQTPTPSFDDRQQSGSILRHVIYQGITAQIGSAAVSCDTILTSIDIKKMILGPNGSWIRICSGCVKNGGCWDISWIHLSFRQFTDTSVVLLRRPKEAARSSGFVVVQI